MTMFRISKGRRGDLEVRWPLRVALARVAPEDYASFRDRAYGTRWFPEVSLDLRRWEEDSRACDVLIVEGPLADAAAWVEGAAPKAGVVVVLAGRQARTAEDRLLLRGIRARTAARTVTIGRQPDVGRSIARLVVAMSQAHPLGEALAEAFGPAVRRSVRDRGFYTQTGLPDISVRMGRGLYVLSELTGNQMLFDHSTRLGGAAGGAFAGEMHEARDIAEVVRAVDQVIADQTDERILQCLVKPEGNAPANTFVAGQGHTVDAWIGPREDRAIAGPVFDESPLDWELADSFRLQVVLDLLLPEGGVQQQEIVLARAGPSTVARFLLELPHNAREVAARLIVIHEGKVLQTAMLQGVAGRPALLAERFVMRQHLGDLGDRRPFDLALVVGGDDRAERLIASAAGNVKLLTPAGVEAIQTAMAATLHDAADLKPAKEGLVSDRKARALLAKLAVHGRDLHARLEERNNLSVIVGTRRVSVITTGQHWTVPIELAYDRPAPSGPDVMLCPRWVATDGTGPCDAASCPAGDGGMLCPLGFWGLSKTIERFHLTPVERGDLDTDVVLADARPNRSTLRIGRSLFAAHRPIVTAADREIVNDALGTGVVPVDTWSEWCKTLAQNPATDLLVLLPHTEYLPASSTLFLSTAQSLPRGLIERKHVTGGHDDRHPFVVLFGCRTSGTAEDQAGFAGSFMNRGGSVVFTSLASLAGPHAAKLASRLVTAFGDGSEPLPVGDRLTEFRRGAVRDGLVAALAITAYGDADWRV